VQLQGWIISLVFAGMAALVIGSTWSACWLEQGGARQSLIKSWLNKWMSGPATKQPVLDPDTSA